MKGFTLIELLVVVLIIGILSAVAVPQYQKAVWRSRNAKLKSWLRSLQQAQEAYYMANGAYATQFGQLDIDFPFEQGPHGRGVCDLATDGTPDAMRVGDHMQLTLGFYKGDSTISAQWIDGKYKCTGFIIHLSLDEKKLLTCMEARNGTSTIKPGEFCVDIEHGAEVFAGNSMAAGRYMLP